MSDLARDGVCDVQFVALLMRVLNGSSGGFAVVVFPDLVETMCPLGHIGLSPTSRLRIERAAIGFKPRP